MHNIAERGDVSIACWIRSLGRILGGGAEVVVAGRTVG
jgi:hypothetical protein